MGFYLLNRLGNPPITASPSKLRDIQFPTNDTSLILGKSFKKVRLCDFNAYSKIHLGVQSTYSIIFKALKCFE